MSLNTQSDPKRRTIFVSGLAYTVTEADLKDYFCHCGEIDLIKLPKYKNTEKNVGYCHITFATDAARDEALTMNSSYLKDRYMDIQAAKGPQNQPKVVEIDEIQYESFFYILEI